MKKNELISIFGVASILIGAFAYDIQMVVKLLTVWEGWFQFTVKLIYVAAFIPVQVAALVQIMKTPKGEK